jgi:3-phenylpropionate/trans-cinnamate dioxygenase ferredoxin reductase subunit
MDGRVLVVGAGQAGSQVVQSLRAGGYRGPITLAGDEPHPPYQRPPLSKKFLIETVAADRLEFRAASHYADIDVALKLGVACLEIEPDRGRARFADGSEERFDRLVLATGTRARRLSMPGIDLPGVATLRNLADAWRLRAAMQPGARFVVIGGGYIGLEVAAVARQRGVDVTVVETADRVMSRVVSPEVSAFYKTLHRSHGVDLRLGRGVAGILGEATVIGVELSSAETIFADMVLVSTGAIPVTELALEAGLAVDDGVLVDAFTLTSHPRVHAIGDCARFPSARFGRPIRLESVQNAIDQAKACAAALIGRPEPYDPVPWFWSDQYDVKLQIAGLSQGYDRVEILGSPQEVPFAVAYLAGDRLLAVDAVNHPRVHMLSRRAIGLPWRGFPALAERG